MDLTAKQLAFLADLRKGRCRATAAQDASVIGPLVRAHLVRWEEDTSEAETRHRPLGSSFTLTEVGALCLAEHAAQECAVNVQQLAKIASQAEAQRSMIDMQQDAQKIRNARAAERTRVVARRLEQDRH